MIDTNIVCFGPTNSGKSTLAGYLMSHQMSENEYENKINTFRMEYGKDFQERRALSYFVDTGKDEYKKQSESSTIGTSKRKHITGVNIDDDFQCTLIDTPGTDKRWRNSFQGIYMGDIGIFIIEISTLLDLLDFVKGSYEYEKYLNNLLAPVYLWEKYGRLDQLIIAISKMDLCNYNQYLLTRFTKVLRSVPSLEDIPIIPISINVKKHTDINIFSETARFKNSQCLLSAIKKVYEKIDIIDESEQVRPLLAVIDKSFKKTSLLKESALRIKVIDGKIRLGDSVFINPVEHQDKAVILKATVKSLLYEANRRPVRELSKNHIGGIILSRMHAGRNSISLKDIKLLNTSMLRDTESRTAYGNFLVFNIKEDNNSKQIFEKPELNTDVKLIWFGKIVFLRILSVIKKLDQYQICLMNTREDYPQFCFQKDSEGNIIHKDYVLQYREKFVKAHLKVPIILTDENRKDVVIYLRHNYSDLAYEDKLAESHYFEKNDQTILSVKNINGIDLVKILFSGNIDKSDILEVSVKQV